MPKFKVGDVLKYNSEFLKLYGYSEDFGKTRIKISYVSETEYVSYTLVPDNFNFYIHNEENEYDEEEHTHSFEWLDAWLEKENTLEQFVEDKLRQNGYIK